MRIGVTFLQVLVVVIVGTTCTVSTSSNTTEVTVLSPIEYFGGSDHESYMQWYNENGAKYTGCLYLEATDDFVLVEGVSNRNGVAVHWRVDEVEELLYLSFAARAQDGWIGLGMAEAGGMSGADLVIYETSKPNTLTDAYVLRTPQPLIDDCQDWQYVSSRNDGGFLIVEGTRKFDTKDTQDRIVINDAEQFVVAQKIIAAWSNDSDVMEYHGKVNRARGALRWFGIEDEITSFRRQMAEEATGFFDLSFGNYSIKTNVTEYVKYCFDWSDDIVPQGLPEYGNVVMIAVDIVAEKSIQPFLHHISFLASQDEHNQPRICKKGDITSIEQYLYGWTFGTAPFRFPNDVGVVLGLGEKNGLQGFRCDVHYNNPKMIEGMIDTSKLRVYYSSNPRKYEMGVVMMADAAVELRTTPISAGLSKHTFDCSSQCSLLVLDEPITVFAEAFHMHGTGSAGLNYHTRNGEVIRRGVVDYFDFDQSGLHAIRQRPFEVLPGDSFSTTCIFDSKSPTTFGFESVEEMCFFSMLYYPAKELLGQAPWTCGVDVPVTSCNASYFLSDQYSLSDAQSLSPSEIDTFYERTFGSESSNQCSLKPPLTFTTSDTNKSGKTNILIILLSITTLCGLHAVLG